MLFMDFGVMELAEQNPVDVGSFTMMSPILDMMGLAPGDRPITPGKRASFVPQGEGFPNRGGEQPVRPAHVENFGFGAEDGGDEVCVAGDPPCFGGADRATVG